ncbi:TIGR01777 family oxidoreductase [Mycetocola zhujimingii]|uniref:TIGR01777 family protein n=1 Tax=Mycetocola zhujimingii TaxID=2079792 RepID=A0A2U1TDZ4_9MICO|nr:TIGR01777 family oxidoreductase [Mycetocola zhujimingii]PWC07117.1 TIGR01777 family protein [Mycetocola zhujimingii]
MRIVISGASGLVGQALTAELSTRGHQVVRLVRRPSRSSEEVTWDPASRRLDPGVISGADAVINLSGASIGRLPWTRQYKRTIMSSRIDATSTLVTAIRGADVTPKVFLSASAAGYYGSRPGEVLTEDSPRGTGFLSDVAEQWETAALRVSDITRVVTLRSGIVLAVDGVLKPLLRLTRLGVSGPLGGGTQHWPWVSLDDEVAAIVHLLDSDLAGPVNITGPTPATATALMQYLAKRMRRPFWLPVPAFAVRLLLGDAAKDLLLVDQRTKPERLFNDGFIFRHGIMEQAVDAALERGR